MIAVWSGNTAAARSRNVSGVSGWKFAGLRSRSVLYGVGAMAPSSVQVTLAGRMVKDQLPVQAERTCRSGSVARARPIGEAKCESSLASDRQRQVLRPAILARPA